MKMKLKDCLKNFRVYNATIQKPKIKNLNNADMLRKLMMN